MMFSHKFTTYNSPLLVDGMIYLHLYHFFFLFDLCLCSLSCCCRYFAYRVTSNVQRFIKAFLTVSSCLKEAILLWQISGGAAFHLMTSHLEALWMSLAYLTIAESNLHAHKASLFFCLLLHLTNRSRMIK
jgi:hypothetical protein